MRTAARLTLVLAALAAFTATEARAQAQLSFSVGVGPLFAGVGFGIGGGHYSSSSLFMGSSFGLSHRSPYANHAYGIYSEVDDGWRPGYRSRGYGSSYSFSCWDYYWDTYWDLTREVKLRFDKEGISIPFPQRDVHVKEQKLA